MVILFDIDDTLVDHSSAAEAGALALHRHLRPAISAREFSARWAAALDRHFERYLSGEISFQDQRRDRVRDVTGATLADDEADRIFREYQSVYEGAWALFDDVLPCLEQLSAARVGVISNGETLHQRQKLVHTGIADRFEHIVISDACGHAKPSPDIFLHACHLMGSSPRDVVYVGDRYDVDACGARRAGLTGIWLDRRRTRTGHHERPIVSSLDEIAAAIGAA